MQLSAKTRSIRCKNCQLERLKGYVFHTSTSWQGLPGSGMSSFGYLKNLPVDYLKIDGHFVKDILADPATYAIVESINHVGHVMGLKTIAEYVENRSLRERLDDIGVDYVQGFEIARPAPILMSEVAPSTE